jgi:hypothetical protein
MLRPIARGALEGDHAAMVQLAIRCQPHAPVSTDELKDWLSRQVDGLRAGAPHAIVRLLRLTQGGPDADLEAGWLVEVELPAADAPLGGHWLADAVRDMRMLGLQPTLLAPLDPRANGRGS